MRQVVFKFWRTIIPYLGFWTFPHCQSNCRSSSGLSIMLAKQHVLHRWDVRGIHQPTSISCTLILWLLKGQQETTMTYSPQLDLRFLDDFHCFQPRFSDYWNWKKNWNHEFQTWLETALLSQFWPRLAVVYAMKGKPWNFLAWFGIKCSTWVGVNAGTSWRSACSSIGDFCKLSVRQGNQMLERTSEFKKQNTFHHWCCYVLWKHPSTYIIFQNHVLCRTICLLAVVTATHGVWCLEQPGSSVLEFYPTWLHFLNACYNLYGISATSLKTYVASNLVAVNSASPSKFSCGN